MSKRKSEQPKVYVYANPANPQKGISYFSIRDNVVTVGSLSEFDLNGESVQTRITVQSLQNHLDAGYDLVFGSAEKNHLPINPRIQSHLESQLKFPEKTKHGR